MATALNTPDTTAADNRNPVTAQPRTTANTGFFDVIGDLALSRKRQREQSTSDK
ncbi:hypothetical protein [uncultured Thalassolituus sp.]|jgi:hypothetical protein|uniref:hypothetical protein n=1 Tax=Thalassolituus sp. TaxID=2030822 RepID=UPI0026353518|nr:hypothetical protein [uncultured Thalassolituus sp.]